MRVLPLLAVALQLAAAPTERPNLLFMMADQMRYDRLGVVSAGVLTPALDRLARQGVRFSREAEIPLFCLSRALRLRERGRPRKARILYLELRVPGRASSSHCLPDDYYLRP